MASVVTAPPRCPMRPAHPDGSLELLTGGSALGSLEWHATPRLDFYGYYGGEYAKRAWYNTGFTNQNQGTPQYGQPILAGYGAPTNDVSGCYTETLPTSSPNGGAMLWAPPRTATPTRAISRKAPQGIGSACIGAFTERCNRVFSIPTPCAHTWQGIGDPNNNIPGSPKAIDNMWFTSFRYYLPQ